MKRNKNKPAIAVPLVGKSRDQDRMKVALAATTPDAATAPVSPATPLPVTQTPLVGAWLVGSSYDVPLNLITPSKNNARVYYKGEEVDATSLSLQEKQLIDAWGYVKDGRIVLTDGQKRLKGATAGGLPSLRVKIIEPPASDWGEYLISRKVNTERSTQSCLDDAVRWKGYLEDGTFQDQDAMAHELDIKKSDLSKVLGLNRIPTPLMRSMSEHDRTSSISIAYEISCIFAREELSEEQAHALAQDVIEATQKDDLSFQKVKALIEARVKGPRQRARALSHPVTYGSARGQIKTFPSKGTFELVLTGLTEDEITKLEQRTREVLSEKH